jgi:SAM-dependent methyltransferase
MDTTESYPVTDPVELEKKLFRWGLPVQRPWVWFGDWESGVVRESDWTTPEAWQRTFDICEPDDWRGNHVLAWMTGEWYAQLFRDCRTVLDVGCQDGRPSLYLAQYVPEVVGIDVDRVSLERARRAAREGRRSNVRFELADAQDLPYADGVFDGVSFGAAFAYPGTDARKELEEIRRVLRPGGILALFTFHVHGPAAPQAAPEIGRFFPEIDGDGRPFVHCWVESRTLSRLYRVYLAPESALGLCVLSRARGRVELPESVVADLRGRFVAASVPRDSITEVYFTGEEEGSVHADPIEFEHALSDVGFGSIESWFLPDEVAFATALREDGILDGLRRDHLLPYLRALARSSRRVSGCRSPFVSCRRP